MRQFFHDHVVVILFVYLTLMGGAILGTALYAYQIARSAHDAGCALRADQIDTFHSSIEFLKTHPDGAPGLATRADILRRMIALRQSVDSLKGLDCDGQPRTLPPSPTR